MRQYIRASRPTMLLAAFSLAALAACGDKAADTASLNTDSTLGRDLAMATDSAQPTLQDVPAAPPPVVAPAAPPPPPMPTAPKPRRTATTKPSAPSPTPAPAPAPVAITGVVASGTSFRFAASTKVCSNTVAVGGQFTASLAASVTATNGIVVPEGATGTFAVVEAKTAKGSNDQTSLTVKLVSVTYGGRTYPLEATVQSTSAERVRSSSKGTDAKKVAGGAILGAIAGQLIGKGTRGTMIGAAATANFDTCINAGAGISATLDAPVTVRPAAMP
jgi:hypothetical protein